MSPITRMRVTSITTTSLLLLAGWILYSLYRRFHSFNSFPSYAREEIRGYDFLSGELPDWQETNAAF